MNTAGFTSILDNPGRIDDGQLAALQELIEAYPYFQSARALELKALKQRHSYRYNDALKKAAAHTTDRDILFEYITAKEFSQHAVSDHIKQHDSSVSDIEVKVEDVTADEETINMLQ